MCRLMDTGFSDIFVYSSRGKKYFRVFLHRQEIFSCIPAEARNIFVYSCRGKKYFRVFQQRQEIFSCIPAEARNIFRLSKSPDRRWGPHSSLFNIYRDSLPALKRPGCEADQSHQTSAELKNKWSYVSAPPTCRHGVDKD
jgi:hypothetical protein